VSAARAAGQNPATRPHRLVTGPCPYVDFSPFRRARAELAIRATQEKLAAQRRKIMEMQQHYAAAQKAAAGAGAGGR